MSNRSIRSRKFTIAQRSRSGIPGLCLVAMVATACSFDAGKLRAPKDPARDAASYRPDTFDVGAGVGLDPDADGRADGQRAVGDLAIRVDGPILGDGSPVDWTGGQEVSVGLDGADDAPGPDPGAIDGGSMASGGAGGSADGSATGGVGGMAGEVGGGGGTDVDGGLVGAGGEATGGSGGVGGTGGGGTGAVATGGTGGGGTGGVYLDAAAPDASDSGADGAPTIDPDLVLWYRFDETSGTTAYDSAAFGGVARNATLATAGMGAGATFSTVKQVGTRALAFSSYTYYAGSGSYVVIPTLHTLAPDAVTIAVWVRLDVATANQNWERIFDYGDSSTGPNWFNLTARSSSSPYGPIFAMSNTGHATTDQQRLISSTAITANVWHHVAIVLGAGAPYTGFMYLDGVVVASNDAMTLHLADIGSTVNNWLGRSEFTSDPYFSGSMDDFRVYKRAFTQEEIAALMTVR